MWTEQNVALLRAKWSAGVFASEIARLLSMTRNAVIGKANRLGLEKRKRTPAGKPSSDRPLSAALRNKPERTVRTPKPTRVAPDKAEVVHINDHAIPLAQRRSLAAIKDNECHFPVGDPNSAEFFYCGAPVEGELAYCRTHHQRMFTAPRPRPKPHPIYRANPVFRRA